MLQIQETNNTNGPFQLEKYDSLLSYPRLFLAHQRGLNFFPFLSYSM